jgi:hypothetical protein
MVITFGLKFKFMRNISTEGLASVPIYKTDIHSSKEEEAVGYEKEKRKVALGKNNNE